MKKRTKRILNRVFSIAGFFGFVGVFFAVSGLENDNITFSQFFAIGIPSMIVFALSVELYRLMNDESYYHLIFVSLKNRKNKRLPVDGDIVYRKNYVSKCVFRRYITPKRCIMLLKDLYYYQDD